MPFKRLSSPSFFRTLRRSLTVLIVLLLSYAVIGFVALPALVKFQGAKVISDKLHRPTSIGKVDFNPFTLDMNIHDFKIMEPDGATVFTTYDTLVIDLSYQSLLKFAPVVEQMRLIKPYVHLVRLDARRTSIDDLIELITSQPPSDKPARFSLNNIQIEDGRIEVDDRPARARHEINGIHLGLPFISSLPADVAIYVEPSLSANVNGTPLRINGKARPFADPRDAVVDVKLDDLDLTRYLAYLPLAHGVTIPSGKLNGVLAVTFRQEKNKAPAMLLSGSAMVKDLRVLAAGDKPVVRLPELTVSVKDLNILASRYAIDRLTVTGLETNVSRAADGTLNLQQLLAPARNSSSPAKGGGFAMALREVVIRNAGVHYTDAAPAKPLRADLAGLSMTLQRIALDTGKKSVSVGDVSSQGATLALQLDAGQRETTPDGGKGAGASQPAATPAYDIRVGKVMADNWTLRFEDRTRSQPVAMEANALNFRINGYSTTAPAPSQLRLTARVNGKGTIDMEGSVGVAPLQAELALKLAQVDVLPLQPYFTEHLNVQLSRATVSSNGKVKLSLGKDGALTGAYQGSLNLGNLATADASGKNEFLRWNALNLLGANVNFSPLSVAVDEVKLSDFFARVIIDANGHINLQDMLKAQTDAPVAGRAAATPVKAAQSGQPRKDAAERTGIPPVVIRKLLLENGRVRFTDNFIKPNYSASLMNFGGTVTGLSSDPASTAAVTLRGEVNGAPLSIAGRVNPLRRNMYLDLKANVRGMELASLSPYSNRYIGYGIEKGKLSFEVAYQLEDRKLTAQNRLILDQLTLGAPSDSPLAIKLPVQLALALLRDNRGVIDVNVPVGGSLDDPQFSLGGVIFKVFANAIAKAVTQPFAFLASVFGGNSNEQLASMPFPAGTADITSDGETRLRTLAKALADRPALNLEITGRADAGTDVDGLKRVAVDRKVRNLKLRELRARGETPDRSRITVSPAEYPELLKRAYKEENFNKPRNLLGLPKTLPVPEMEKLLAENAQIDEDDLLTLANRRAQTVKDWLIAQGKIPAERLFILAGKTTGDGKGQSPARVDFSLR